MQYKVPLMQGKHLAIICWKHHPCILIFQHVQVTLDFLIEVLSIGVGQEPKELLVKLIFIDVN